MTRLVGALVVAILVSFAEAGPVATCQVQFCTACSGSECLSCEPGFFLDAVGNQCRACTSIQSCTSPLTCTTSNDAECTSCADGRYLQQGSPDACPACPAVNHCTRPDLVACTGPLDSQCQSCDDGYYLQE